MKSFFVKTKEYVMDVIPKAIFKIVEQKKSIFNQICIIYFSFNKTKIVCCTEYREYENIVVVVDLF